MTNFKPMLAVDAKDIKFPVYASAKIDGIRAAIRNGAAVSRTLKQIPNYFVQDFFAEMGGLDGLDGELTVGPPNDHNVMQATTSGVMSKHGEPDFTYWVFDFWTAPDMPYGERLRLMQRSFNESERLRTCTRIKLLPQTLIHSQSELNAFEQVQLEHGFEGIMVRSPMSPYKYGRSTAREGYLLKVKRFVDAEAVIIGFEELLHNANKAEINALGLTERSSHAANKVPMGTLGALRVRDTGTGIEFSIGTGYTAAQRQHLWNTRETLLNKIVKYKHFEVGSKDAPRFPVWLGMRHPDDIGEPK